MKKTIAFFIMIFLALCLSITASAVEDFTFDENCVIVVSQDCEATENSAACVLQRYIKQITGIELTIADDSADSAEKEIIIGQTNRESVDISSLKDGGFNITSTPDSVSICGAGNRGTIYGVYALLENYCGCHWYTSTLQIIPEISVLSIPGDIDFTRDSFFEYTDTDWLSPRDTEYSLANGLSGGTYRTIEDENGGTVNYISNFCHTLTTQFCSADTYFNDHPEYFALRNGERVNTQLCLTNDDVFNVVLKEVLALLEESHDPKVALQIISLTQHDNQLYCECNACAELDELNGSHSGTMITFVNKIAAEVALRGYDNVAIDTFAYQYTRQAPSNVVPLDNVIVRLCTIECCFCHALNNPDCEENALLMADLSAWAEICSRIYVWDYTTNYSQTLGIFPDFDVLQANMQVFYENNVKGIYEEGNYYMDTCNTEFGELRSYLLSKLMQNPYLDYAAETAGFLSAYYGEGWQNIADFLNITSEFPAGDDGHCMIGEAMRDTLSLSSEQVAQCDTLWQQAIADCTDETQKANIERSQLSWRYWKACNRVAEFSSFASAAKQNRALYDDILASGTSKYNEGTKISLTDLSSLILLANPSDWCSSKTTPSGIIGTIVLIIAAILLALSGLMSIFLFILGLKKRKYLYLAHLPSFAVMTEIVLWHRRAYLAWKDIDEYALTLIIICVFFAFLGLARASLNPNSTVRRKLLGMLTGALLFFVPYESTILIINNLIFKGNGNHAAIGVAFGIISAIAFALTLSTLRKLAKKPKIFPKPPTTQNNSDSDFDKKTTAAAEK